MKKIALLSAVVALAVSSMAFADGFYAGGDLGYSNNTTNSAQSSDEVAFKGAFGDLVAGYGMKMGSSLYLGAEFTMQLNSAKFKSNVRKQGALGVSVRPGFYVNDNTMAYGVLGYDRGYFKSGTTKVSRNGLAFGAGVQTTLTDAMKMRVEFDHTKYSKDEGVSLNSDDVKVGVVYNIG